MEESSQLHTFNAKDCGQLILLMLILSQLI